MTGHHIWCNYWMAVPVSECSMCKRFFELYPYEGLTGHEMVAKYFASAVPRSPDDGVQLHPTQEDQHGK